MIYLIDSSAVINCINFQFDEKHSYIATAAIIGEFRDMRCRHLAENALHQGILKIENPSEASIAKIEQKIASKGFERLSKADVSLLALAWEYKKKRKRFKVVSDDFSIQNFLSLLEVPFSDTIQGKIKSTISFTKSCPACGKSFPADFREKSCPVCGNRLKKARKHIK